jgi:hypothetical protein
MSLALSMTLSLLSGYSTNNRHEADR